jgi:hypothetical protein
MNGQIRYGHPGQQGRERRYVSRERRMRRAIQDGRRQVHLNHMRAHSRLPGYFVMGGAQPVQAAEL